MKSPRLQAGRILAIQLFVMRLDPLRVLARTALLGYYHPAAMRWRWMLLAMMILFAQTVAATQQTSMARSEALTKLDRHQVGWAGPGGMSKAMAAAQEALVATTAPRCGGDGCSLR